MQIIQFVFSVIIALCAVAMFVGAVITLSPIKVVSVVVVIGLSRQTRELGCFCCCWSPTVVEIVLTDIGIVYQRTVH